MREVLDGKSHAPEMDIEEELCNVIRDFKAWKKQFDVRALSFFQLVFFLHSTVGISTRS